MVKLAQKINQNTMNKGYSLMTAILVWCGLVVVTSLYITIPLTAVLANEFNVTTSEVTWTSSAFSFAYAIGFLFFGPLSDRLGRKQIIVFGLIMLSVVTPILGMLNSLPWFIFFRAIQGIAAATFAPAALAYIVEVFPIEKRITTIGFVSTGFLMAGIIGQVFSSLINQMLNWNCIFYFLAIFYLVSAILVIIFIPQNEIQQDKRGIVTIFKQMGVVLFKKNLFLCYLVTITLLLAFVGMYIALGNYLSGPTFNLSSEQILIVRIFGIIGMLLSPFAGKLVEKFGINNVLRGGLLLSFIGLGILGINSNVIILVVMSVIFVAGISITAPTLISLIGQLAGTDRGIAVSLYTFILFIGATLGPIVSVNLLKIGSYILTFEVLALLLGFGFIISLLINNKEKIINK